MFKKLDYISIKGQAQKKIDEKRDKFTFQPSVETLSCNVTTSQRQNHQFLYNTAKNKLVNTREEFQFYSPSSSPEHTKTERTKLLDRSINKRTHTRTHTRRPCKKLKFFYRNISKNRRSENKTDECELLTLFCNIEIKYHLNSTEGFVIRLRQILSTR